MIIETSVLKNIRVSVCRPQQSGDHCSPATRAGRPLLAHYSPTARTGRPPLAHSESRATTAYPQRDPWSPTMRAGRPPLAHNESRATSCRPRWVGRPPVAHDARRVVSRHLRTGLVSGPAHFESADSNVVWAYTLYAKSWPNMVYCINGGKNQVCRFLHMFCTSFYHISSSTERTCILKLLSIDVIYIIMPKRKIIAEVVWT